MPLFEIVLRHPDRDEVRLTDFDPRIDGHVRISGRQWRIVAEEDRPAPGITRRYVAAAHEDDPPPYAA